MFLLQLWYQYYCQTSIIWTPKDRTTSQRCQYYNQTSLIRTPKDTSKCPHDRGVCFTVKSPDTDTKETDSSVCITEVSVLQSNLLNMDTWQNQVSTSQRCLYYNRTSWYRHQWDRAKCSHHRGVCFTVGPPDTDTKGAEPSVHITEVSVLESSLLIQTPMRQSQVSALQRSLFCSQTSWYRHQCDRAKCPHYRGVLPSNLLNTDTKGQNQVFTSQRCGGRDCVKLGIIGTKESVCNK